MAKYFNTRVYNSKRTIINVVIVAVCVIGIIICFVLTRNFQGESQNEPESNLSIKNEVTAEINDELSKEMFFSRIENVKLDDIKVVYPDDFDIGKIGTYEITIVVDNEKYSSTLNVVDTTRPELALKEVSIGPNSSYSPRDFVNFCNDNSNENCEINFYSGIDEEGKSVDYSKYKDVGTYAIKIEAKDGAGNQSVGETRLIIKEGATTNTEPETQNPETPTYCKYGNGEYDTEHYTVAISVTSNNCAVSLDLYKSDAMTQEINKLVETESIRIQKDIDALNLSGIKSKSLNRLRTAVVNTTGDGIVGYELRITASVITDNNETKIVADYKLDSNGKRIFISNPYNLPN